jgi:CRP-like cAMP-binding protein
MSLAEELIAVKSLRGLGDAHLHKLAAIARPRECPAGALRFRQGDDSTYIYVRLSGEVRLEIDTQNPDPTVIYSAGPGELLGWSPVLGRRSMTATARTTAPSRLAVLEVNQLNELIDRDPPFGVAFLRQLAIIVSHRLGVTRRCLASVQAPFDSPRYNLMREGSD